MEQVKALFDPKEKDLGESRRGKGAEGQREAAGFGSVMNHR